MPKKDLSIWEGTGLPDYEDWHMFSVDSLDMTQPEIEGWIEACKKEAWVHEQMGKREDEHQEYNKAVARYFWRRCDTLRDYLKILEKDLDDDDKRVKDAAEWQDVLIKNVSCDILKRDDIARTYAVCLGYEDKIDWKLVNAAIIARWSPSGLSYIKNLAWKLAP